MVILLTVLIRSKVQWPVWYKNDLLTIVQFKPDKDKIWIADSITYTKAASMVAYRTILASVFQDLKQVEYQYLQKNAMN